MPEYAVENLTRGLPLASRVRLAGKSGERRRGLLGISELPAGAGIWINPCEAVHTFCMRITLDALFLDSELRVKKISAHLKPWRVAICLAATSVLELAAGAAAGALTQPGDQLSFHPLEASCGETPHENGAGSR
jgi:uncharacterized membrane protein (UPF0127 family)